MKTYSKMELDQIIADHKKWLEGCGGGKRANLSFANLSFANLSSADLSFANLSSANLSSADLRFANLSFANLRSANLSSANLSSADLRFANLSFANLSFADLSFANLSFANLSSAKYMGIEIASARFVSGLYRYICAAVVAEDGTPYVRMGCLWHSVADWDRITIRESNTLEFPNGGSETSEQRARAFEFMRNEALLMATKFKPQPKRGSNGRFVKKEQ